jgi:putative addiction module component (TIGR02574 family)
MSTHPLLKVEISQLSISERIQLAEDLWDSILDRQDEVQLDPAQQQELDRRLEQRRQNTTTGSTWETVKQRLYFPQCVGDISDERSLEEDSEVDPSYYS